MAEKTIEAYLRGKVGYEIPDNAIETILIDRGIAPGTPVSELARRDRELCTADLYMWCASTPSTRSNTEDADGDWRHVEGGWQTSAYDKRQLRAMANDIYAKWEESTTNSTIRIINL